jgi:hypothetical protein
MKRWFQALFLKWSGHKCTECDRIHGDSWDRLCAELDADPEWQQLLASQFDENGNLLPYSWTPNYARLRAEREAAWRAFLEKRGSIDMETEAQGELVDRVRDRLAGKGPR